MSVGNKLTDRFRFEKEIIDKLRIASILGIEFVSDFVPCAARHNTSNRFEIRSVH